MKRYNRNHRDANEPPLVKLARRLGIYLRQEGPLDWWAFHRRLAWIPVEIKDPARRGKPDEFEPSQIAFMADCDAIGAPYAIWYTEADVLRFAQARITA